MSPSAFNKRECKKILQIEYDFKKAKCYNCKEENIPIAAADGWQVLSYKVVVDLLHSA